MLNIPLKLSQLFKEWSGKEPESIIELPQAGSQRRYFRLASGDTTSIGAWNPVIEENNAFLHFSRHFHRLGLHVPRIYAADPGKEICLMEDLGDISLFSLVEQQPAGEFTHEIELLYRKTLTELVRFQITGGQGLDYSLCYPQPEFDRQSILFDLNYFKYFFLKLHVNFHEIRLENDFNALASFLLEADSRFFMYRDFQSRNILIKNNQPYFIDYQGGRKGPLQYDVASLLFQVRADLPFEMRERLLDDYLEALSKQITLDKLQFKKFYNGYVLIRLLQVLGAYGFRGLIEKKPHFLASIPYALKNIKWWLENVNLPLELPELMRVLKDLAEIKKYDTSSYEKRKTLTVFIRSFSYRQGIPDDLSGNGGGFVFDCRALPNPGREEKYRPFNGRDQIIIDFLKDKPEVIGYLEDTERLVGRSIQNYLARGFNSLVVNFGCTGGQHRSVYCAETLAGKLREKYTGISVLTEHVVLDNKRSK